MRKYVGSTAVGVCVFVRVSDSFQMSQWRGANSNKCRFFDNTNLHEWTPGSDFDRSFLISRCSKFDCPNWSINGLTVQFLKWMRGKILSTTNLFIDCAHEPHLWSCTKDSLAQWHPRRSGQWRAIWVVSARPKHHWRDEQWPQSCTMKLWTWTTMQVENE